MNVAQTPERDDTDADLAADLLGIEIVDDGAWTRVRVSGEIDLLTERFTDTVLSVLDAGRATAVVVDLTDVTFMGSVGMSALMSAHHRAHELDTRLLVVADGPATGRLLQLVGLTNTLSVFPTLAAAAAALDG